MSDFSDRPFVMGSLNGLRAFDVDDLGRLTGCSFKSVFKPGVNVASHGGGTPTGQMQAALSQAMTSAMRTSLGRLTYGGESLTGTFEYDPPKSEKKQHTVAGVDCGCGFYAYFDGTNTYAESRRITGIIQATGVCTVGSRGFRAEKAELVALVLPQKRTHPRWYDRLADGDIRRQWIAVIVALLALGFGTGFSDPWWCVATSASAFATALAMFLLMAPASFHQIDRSYPDLHTLSSCPDHSVNPKFELVRRNYPDVPVYKSQAAALKAHPVTPPVFNLPTPDDEDFWTRSAK